MTDVTNTTATSSSRIGRGLFCRESVLCLIFGWLPVACKKPAEISYSAPAHVANREVVLPSIILGSEVSCHEKFPAIGRVGNRAVFQFSGTLQRQESYAKNSASIAIRIYKQAGGRRTVAESGTAVVSFVKSDIAKYVVIIPAPNRAGRYTVRLFISGKEEFNCGIMDVRR